MGVIFLITSAVVFPDDLSLEQNTKFSIIYPYDTYMQKTIQHLIRKDIPLMKDFNVVGVVRITNIAYVIPDVRITYKITKLERKV